MPDPRTPVPGAGVALREVDGVFAAARREATRPLRVRAATSSGRRADELSRLSGGEPFPLVAPCAGPPLAPPAGVLARALADVPPGVAMFAWAPDAAAGAGALASGGNPHTSQ
ncbi:hypothetical protein [Actinomadura gamaensis]|uniref:Uncharacterized protein n=1 Tax=Actinomadura gamaensis TaxID=1763541 RepID=A0ABV9UB12_9ACTN